MADSSGNLVQHYAYSAFGKILSIEDQNGTDVMANPLIKTSYTYTNREYDEESGMYYYRARYYEPSVGRFIQEDPHAGKLDVPITFTTKYTYAANNPALNIDPNGRLFIAAMIIGAVIGGYMAHTSGRPILEGMIIGAVAGVVGAYAGSLGAYVGAQSGMAGMSTLAGVTFGATFGAWAGSILGGNLAVMRGASYEEGSNFGSNVGGLVGGLTGGLNGYFGGELDKAIYRSTSEYLLSEFNIFMKGPVAFLTEHPAIMVGAGVFLATELDCDKNEEYKIGEGCVRKR